MIMQCKDYREDKVCLPVYGQVKMNGIFGRWDTGALKFYTRSGKVITGVSHLIKECMEAGYPSFDGELVVPGVDFFTANGMIRSHNETPTCMFYVFDYPNPLCATRTRLAEYTRLIDTTRTPHVHPLKYHILHTHAAIDAFYKTVLKAKHEGIVLKHIESKYYNGKKYFVQKRVPSLSTECEIIDVIEGKKSFTGMMGAFLVDFNGVAIKVGMGPGVDHAYRRKVWAGKGSYIGETLKVEYKSVTPQGSMQSPKIMGVRWDI